MEPNTTETTGDESLEAEGTEGSPEPKTTTEQDPIALARKRQAGAEAARQKAQEEASELRKRLEVFEAANRTASEKDLADNAKLQERLAFESRRADEAEANAQARILDTLYPAARKELPEVTDEVRLAKFEALLADPTVENKTPPPPQNPNASNRAASGDATVKQPAEESSQDILANLKLRFPQGRPD